jgi:glycosyltransferase involved in cell wall biosynthesis
VAPAGIVHVCYAGASGSTRAALNIAAASARPARHCYVFYGVGPLRDDHVAAAESFRCAWRHVPKRPGLDLACYGRVAKAALALAPAAVVLHGQRALPVAVALRLRRWRLPIVGVMHGALGYGRGGRPLDCLFAAVTTRQVAVAHPVAEEIRRRPVLGRLARRLEVIPNGLPVDFWRGERAHRAGRRLVMVATLDARKDHATLLHAAALLSRRGLPVEVDIVGDGPLRASLEAMANSLGLTGSIHFAGELPPEAVRQRLLAASAAVLLSHGEVLPMALLEAMAAGVPVVASDVGGISQIVQHGRTGLLVAGGDAPAAAAAIARLLTEPQLAAELAQAAAAMVASDYSAAAMATRYERLIDDMLAR